MARKRRLEQVNDPIVEIAPETQYSNCSFDGTEFTGCGPAVFNLCAFYACVPEHIPQIRYVNCISYEERKHQQRKAD